MTSVSIDCSGISAPDISIGVGPGGSYMFADDGLGRPNRTWRRNYMPDTPGIHGSELVDAALETSSLPLKVVVLGTSTGDVAAKTQALIDGLSQFVYETTVDVDGHVSVWTCDPADIGSESGAYDFSMVAQFFDVFAITIPVYPIPGSA